MPPLAAAETKLLFASGASNAKLLQSSRATDRIKTVRQLVSHVVVGRTSLEISVRQAGLREMPKAAEASTYSISVPVQLKRGNHATRLVVRDATTQAKVA